MHEFRSGVKDYAPGNSDTSRAHAREDRAPACDSVARVDSATSTTRFAFVVGVVVGLALGAWVGLFAGTGGGS